MKHIKGLGLALIMIALFSFTLSEIELVSKLFFGNKIELKVPKTFDEMSEEMAKAKYPSSTEKAVVYTNPQGSINVAIKITKNRAKQEEMDNCKSAMVQAFRQSYPTAEWKETGVKVINGRKVGYLKLITPAVDTKVYNQLFFTDFEGELLIGTFNCTEKEMKKWQPVAEEIMNSLKLK
jgi:hypothetical protein